MTCPCSEWEEIKEFNGPHEYDKFVDWIEQQVKNAKVKEIPVGHKFGGFKERWFSCEVCRKVWQLVDHDFPFKGLFKVIEPTQSGRPDS